MSRERLVQWLVLGLALSSVLTSLLLRVVHRGIEVPGWDLLLTVEGEYLLATSGLWNALVETMVKVRTFWLPPAAYSIPYGLVPGALAWWWPSIFWQPLLVFLAWIATLTLSLVAAGWRLSSPYGWAIALLAWGASPSLLSYAVEGYPWGAGMLPHALVLGIALGRRPWRWWTTILGLAVACELPWHGYEIGKTVGVTLLLCAALAPEGGWVRRLAWAATGIAAVVATWWIWPSANMKAFGHGGVGAGLGLVQAWTSLPEGITRLGAAMWGPDPLIMPVLTVAGAIGLAWAGARRNLLAAVWVVQLGLVLLLAASGTDLLRPRRFQIVEGISMIALLAAMPRAPGGIRAALLALLLAGNAWALVDVVRFVQAPRGLYPFSLPGVESPEGVGTVDREAVEWARVLAVRARAGERVVLLHSQACPSEDVTNPAGVLERLYVSLGHETFRDRVVAVEVAGPRYVTVPVVDVRATLDTLVPGMIVELDGTCEPKMQEVMGALATRFDLQRLSDDTRFVRFRLAPPSAGHQ
jgi:hypothetical protein